MDIRHERERITLRAQQQRDLATLARQLSQALPGQIATIRRSFNTEFRSRLNEAKVDLKITLKEEIRAILNDRMRDRAVQNYVAAIGAARDNNETRIYYGCQDQRFRSYEDIDKPKY